MRGAAESERERGRFEAEANRFEAEAKRLAADPATVAGLEEADLERLAQRLLEARERVLAELLRRGDSRKCVGCADKPRTRAATPCGHVAFCEDCCPQPRTACPICRKRVTKWLQLFS